MKLTIIGILLFVLLTIGFAGCTDDSNATRILRQNGYTNIEMTGYQMFSCSDEDDFATGFKAKSPSGQYVSGTVCSGFMKGYTIRFK